MRFGYYLFNAAVFVPVFLLSLTTDVQPHRRIKRLVAGSLLVSLPFILWDIWAVRAGHWSFNERYVVGPYLFGVPVEELLFFFTVPFACMYVWGVVRKHDKSPQKMSLTTMRGVFVAVTLLAALLLLLYWGNGYTRSALIAFFITLLLLVWRRDIVSLRQFWVFQACILGLFLVANTVLTALPIITYGADSFIGFRIGTIPVEDFFFNFALLNAWLIAYGK